MDAILDRFASSSDIGHMGLLFWAIGASVLLARALRMLEEANRRFDEFVRELARFNQRHIGQHDFGQRDFGERRAGD